MTNKITLAVRFIKAYKKHIIVEDDNKEV